MNMDNRDAFLYVYLYICGQEPVKPTYRQQQYEPSDLKFAHRY